MRPENTHPQHLTISRFAVLAITQSYRYPLGVVIRSSLNYHSRLRYGFLLSSPSKAAGKGIQDRR